VDAGVRTRVRARIMAAAGRAGREPRPLPSPEGYDQHFAICSHYAAAAAASGHGSGSPGRRVISSAAQKSVATVVYSFVCYTCPTIPMLTVRTARYNSC